MSKRVRLSLYFTTAALWLLAGLFLLIFQADGDFTRLELGLHNCLLTVAGVFTSASIVAAVVVPIKAAYLAGIKTGWQEAMKATTPSERRASLRLVSEETTG